MEISMCACGSPACKHCNPNIWTGVPENTHGPNPFTQRIAELEAENAELKSCMDRLLQELEETRTMKEEEFVRYQAENAKQRELMQAVVEANFTTDFNEATIAMAEYLGGK